MPLNFAYAVAGCSTIAEFVLQNAMHAIVLSQCLTGVPYIMGSTNRPVD